MPHVSTSGTRNSRKNEEGQPTQWGIHELGRGGKDREAGGGKRAEGEGDSRQKKSAASAGYLNVDEKGKGAVKKHRRWKKREKRRKEGATATRRTMATSRKLEKKGNDSAVA